MALPRAPLRLSSSYLVFPLSSVRAARLYTPCQTDFYRKETFYTRIISKNAITFSNLVMFMLNHSYLFPLTRDLHRHDKTWNLCQVSISVIVRVVLQGKQSVQKNMFTYL